MKTLNILASALAATLIGCGTDPATRAKLIQNAATTVSFDVSQTLKAKYPTELNLTYDSLNAFVAAGGGSVADLKNTLTNLPVSVLQGTNGEINAEGAALGIKQGADLIVSLNTNVASIYVMPAAIGFRNGLGQSLGRAQTP